MTEIKSQCPARLPDWATQMMPGTWMRYPSAFVGEVVIPPQCCESILEHHNQHNRALSRGNAQYLARLMGADLFMLNGEPLIFDWNGTILSAQHRLKGAAISGKPLHIFCVFGVSPEAFKWVDHGKAKTVADRLSAAGEKNYTVLAGCASLIDNFLCGNGLRRGRKGRFNVEDCFRLLGDCPDLRASTDFASKNRSGASCFAGPSPVAALHWVFARVDRDAAELMLSAVMGHQVSREEHMRTVASLANRLYRPGAATLPVEHICAITVKAWNAMWSGDHVKALQYGDSKFPEVFGWDYVDGLPVLPGVAAPEPEEELA